jgi:2-iminobutanoate/2-iminopropanoate deaminase
MKLERLLLGLLAITLVATVSRADKKTARRHINFSAAESNSQRLPFSKAVLVGNTLYLAGDIGLDPKTGTPGETPEAEAKLVLDSMQRTLHEADMTMDDLVSVQVFCSDVSHYAAFNSVYRTYFKGDFPARAFLGSGKLLFDARFEVMGIAVKR